MKKEKPVVVRDSEEIKNVFIQLNIKKGTTTVISNFSAWENIAYILEALGATAQKCVKEGIEKKKVHQAIKNYLTKVLKGYSVD